MTAWPTFFDAVPSAPRTGLSIRGAQIFGHLAPGTPQRDRAVVLDRFLTAGLRRRADGLAVPTGMLTRNGVPVAEVAAWPDSFGIACAGRLLVGTITASAAIDQAQPWPAWQIERHAAYLVSVELELSAPPRPHALAAADVRQRAALARIDTARRAHALNRIAKVRR